VVQNELIVVGDSKESKLFTMRPPAFSVSVVSDDLFLMTASTATFQVLDSVSKVPRESVSLFINYTL